MLGSVHGVNQNDVAQPIRIETTRRVVLNTLFKKPVGGAILHIWGKPLEAEAWGVAVRRGWQRDWLVCAA